MEEKPKSSYRAIYSIRGSRENRTPSAPPTWIILRAATSLWSEADNMPDSTRLDVAAGSEPGFSF